MTDKINETNKKYAQLFSTALGREVLDDINSIAGVSKTIAIPASTGHYDMNALLLAEGGRKLAIIINDRVKRGQTPITKI